MVELDTPATSAGPSALSVEANGINVIDDAERTGAPWNLFWPWFAANVSVLGLGYGAYVLYFGVSFWQGVIAGAIGAVVSFLLCGFIAVAGKRGNAPTMVLSRAAFGVRGNVLSAVISWMLTVGWETVLVILSTQAVVAVFDRLNWSHGTATEAVTLVVVAAVTVIGGVMGFGLIMRLQTFITVITGVLTIVFIILAAKHIHWNVVSALPSGSAQATVGAGILVATAFGLGWVNAAADYSRYLPRSASSSGVVGWTAFGGAVAPVVLLLFGLLIAGSSTTTRDSIGNSPVGGLAQLLPTWFMIPFVIVALLGLIGGAVLDIYSSGLALLAAGLRLPRYAAAFVDGLVMVGGSIYVIFFAKASFLTQFQGFLITLGVPIAAWAGVMLADILLRRREYAAPDLFDPKGRYGAVRISAIVAVLGGTGVGWGLVTNTNASWLTWQGYLLDPFGLGGKAGVWATTGLGVVVALAIGFVVTLVATAGTVRRQEAMPVASAESLA